MSIDKNKERVVRYAGAQGAKGFEGYGKDNAKGPAQGYGGKAPKRTQFFDDGEYTWNQEKSQWELWWTEGNQAKCKIRDASGKRVANPGYGYGGSPIYWRDSEGQLVNRDAQKKAEMRKNNPTPINLLPHPYKPETSPEPSPEDAGREVFQEAQKPQKSEKKEEKNTLEDSPNLGKVVKSRGGNLAVEAVVDGVSYRFLFDGQGNALESTGKKIGNIEKKIQRISSGRKYKDGQGVEEVRALGRVLAAYTHAKEAVNKHVKGVNAEKQKAEEKRQKEAEEDRRFNEETERELADSFKDETDLDALIERTANEAPQEESQKPLSEPQAKQEAEKKEPQGRKEPLPKPSIAEMFEGSREWREPKKNTITAEDRVKCYRYGADILRFLKGGFAHIADIKRKGANQEAVNDVLCTIGREMERRFRVAYEQGGLHALREVERAFSDKNVKGVVRGILTKDADDIIRYGVHGFLMKFHNLSANEYLKFANLANVRYKEKANAGNANAKEEVTQKQSLNTRGAENVARTTETGDVGRKDQQSAAGNERVSGKHVETEPEGRGRVHSVLGGGVAKEQQPDLESGRGGGRDGGDERRGLDLFSRPDGKEGRGIEPEQKPEPSPEEAARAVVEEAQKPEPRSEYDLESGSLDSMYGAADGPSPELIQAPLESPVAVEARQKPGLIEGTPDVADTNPGAIYGVHISELSLDPARFQFKQNVNKKTGAGDALEGVEFDRRKANTILVWRDPQDGKIYVVNGHHRFNLAVESGYDGYLDVRFSDAKTAEEAKVEGAVDNIIDGKGTELDAADILRQHPDIESLPKYKKLIPKNGQLFKKGKALASLADEIYRHLKEGRIEVRSVLPLGLYLGDDQEKQLMLYRKRIAPQPTLPVSRIETMAQLLSGAIKRKYVGDDLPGQMSFFSEGFMTYDEDFDRRVDFIEGIKKTLNAKKATSGKLARGDNAETLSKEANVGDINKSVLKDDSKAARIALDEIASSNVWAKPQIKSILEEGLSRYAELDPKTQKKERASVERDTALRLCDALVNSNANEEETDNGRSKTATDDRPSEAPVDERPVHAESPGMERAGEDGAVSAGDGAGMAGMAPETTAGAGESGNGGVEPVSEPENTDVPDDNSPDAEAKEVGEPSGTPDEISQSIVAETEDEKPTEPEETAQEPVPNPDDTASEETKPVPETPEESTRRPYRSLNLGGTPERVNFILNKSASNIKRLVDTLPEETESAKQKAIDALKLVNVALNQQGLGEGRYNYQIGAIRNATRTADVRRYLTEALNSLEKREPQSQQNEAEPVAVTSEDAAMEVADEVEDAKADAVISNAGSNRDSDGYYTVNEDLARWANDANSYRDYKQGTATREYRTMVNSMRGIAEKRKENCDEETRAKIDRLLDSYERKLANWFDRYYRNESYAPSILVAGGSNFPVKKKERQNNNRRTLWKEHEELNGKYKRLISGVGTAGISSDNKDAVPQLEAKLAALEKRQKDIVEANKFFRKNKQSWEGYDGPLQKEVKSWSSGWGRPRPLITTNNSAEIRRIKGRIEELKSKASADYGDDLSFDGGRTTFNKTDNRIEIYHDDKPDSETISALKHNGFKWSPKKKAWQRMITPDAIFAAKRLGFVPKDWQPGKVEDQTEEPTTAPETAPVEEPSPVPAPEPTPGPASETASEPAALEISNATSDVASEDENKSAQEETNNPIDAVRNKLAGYEQRRKDMNAANKYLRKNGSFEGYEGPMKKYIDRRKLIDGPFYKPQEFDTRQITAKIQKLRHFPGVIEKPKADAPSEANAEWTEADSKAPSLENKTADEAATEIAAEVEQEKSSVPEEETAITNADVDSLLDSLANYPRDPRTRKQTVPQSVYDKVKDTVERLEKQLERRPNPGLSVPLRLLRGRLDLFNVKDSDDAKKKESEIEAEPETEPESVQTVPPESEPIPEPDVKPELKANNKTPPADLEYGEGWDFRGGKITPNYEKDRLEISFNKEVPPRKILKALEEDGFRVVKKRREDSRFPEFVATRKLDDDAIQLAQEYDFIPRDWKKPSPDGVPDDEPEQTDAVPDEPENSASEIIEEAKTPDDENGEKEAMEIAKESGDDYDDDSFDEIYRRRSQDFKPEKSDLPPIPRRSQNEKASESVLDEDEIKRIARRTAKQDYESERAEEEAKKKRVKKTPVTAFEKPEGWTSKVYAPLGEDTSENAPKASDVTLAAAMKKLNAAGSSETISNEEATKTIEKTIFPISSYTDQIIRGEIDASPYQVDVAMKINHGLAALKDRKTIERTIAAKNDPGWVKRLLVGLARESGKLLLPMDTNFPEVKQPVPKEASKNPQAWKEGDEEEENISESKPDKEFEEAKAGIEATKAERDNYDWYGHPGVELPPEEWERFKELHEKARKEKRRRYAKDKDEKDRYKKHPVVL